MDNFETSDTVLPRRFNDFNPPQCTDCHHSDALSLLLPFLFHKVSLCDRCVTFNLSKYNFNGEALPFTFSNGAARFSSLSFIAESEVKSLSVKFKDKFFPKSLLEEIFRVL